MLLRFYDLPFYLARTIAHGSAGQDARKLASILGPQKRDRIKFPYTHWALYGLLLGPINRIRNDEHPRLF